MSRRDERGSGTVLVTGALGVLVVLTAGALEVGAAAGAAHRARTAADLAALAGASALQEGTGNPCSRASELVTRNGADPLSCTLGAAESVRVRVRAEVRGSWPGLPRWATATARAGPADIGLPGP